MIGSKKSVMVAIATDTFVASYNAIPANLTSQEGPNFLSRQFL